MAQNEPNIIGNDLRLSRVLIVRQSALGDVVMTIPIIYSVCRCYPDIEFTLLTSQSKSAIFINKPDNLHVIGADMDGEYRGYRGAKRLLAVASALGHIDALIDLQHDASTKWLRIICRFKGMKVVKFNNAQVHKRQLSRRANKVMLPLASTRDRYREAFFKAGLPLQDRFNGLYGKGLRASHKEYGAITADIKGEKEKWIGIAPFAMYAEKEYPIDKMEEVIDMLSRHEGIRIFVLGAAGREKDIADVWQRKYGCVTSLAGRHFGFPAELALISNLDVLVSMDSANMHLASIVGTRVISIWGATHHYCGFKGWHQSEDDMIQLPLSCRPCSINGDKPCYRRDRLCLTAIRPDTVYARIMEKVGPSPLKQAH